MAEAATAAASGDEGFLKVATIARGGIGTVELVMREKGEFRRLYALKRLHEHLRDDPEIRRMFKEEARVAGLLRHRNVVSVLDVGEDEEGPFLLMDFVDGLPLSRIVTTISAAGDLIPVSICLRIARDVAAGLCAAHDLVGEGGEKLLLVHRDVSPQNILVGFDGSVRVTDFGIAKAVGGDGNTTTHALKGKYGYMSPEQLRFKRLDPRADLFALGVVLWEMLAGKRLYRERNLEDAARRILEEPAPEIEEERADVPPEVEALLLSLLAKDRERRPSSAAEVVDALDLALRKVEDEEGALTVAAFLAERFGPMREEIAEGRARAIEVARRKERQAPQRARLSAPNAPAARGLARLALVVFASAILGAAILLGAQSLKNAETADDSGAPSETESSTAAAPAPTEDEDEGETTTPTPSPREVEPEAAPGRAPDIESRPEVRMEVDPEPAPPRRRRRRPRMRPEMTAMMTALDDWWAE